MLCSMAFCLFSFGFRTCLFVAFVALWLKLLKATVVTIQVQHSNMNHVILVWFGLSGRFWGRNPRHMCPKRVPSCLGLRPGQFGTGCWFIYFGFPAQSRSKTGPDGRTMRE